MANPNSTNPVWDGVSIESVDLTPTNYVDVVNQISAGSTSVFLQANVAGVTDFTVLPALADVPDGHIITIVAGVAASEVRASVAGELINNVDCGTDAAATAVLTSDNANVSNGKKVTLGTTVYTFKTTPIAAYDIDIGTTADGSLTNLAAAINGTTRGTAYYKGTTKHPDITCSAVATHALTITANVKGVSGNAIAKAEDDDHLDWDGTGAFIGEGALAGTNASEYLLASNQICKFTKISAAVGWMGLGWTPIGAIIGAITPD